MKKMHKKEGFTLVEIMIVVMIIGLLAAIGIPNFLRARQNTLWKNAVNNARQLMSAGDQYALEHALTTGTTMNLTDLDTYVKGGIAGLKIGSQTVQITSITVDDTATAEALASNMYSFRPPS